MVTKSIAFGPSAATADTKSSIGSATKIAQAGTIKEIRITGFNGVTDKAESAMLILESNIQKGPFQFACYGAGGEITVGGKRPTEKIDVDIPVAAEEEWTVSITAAEALEEVTVSLLYVV